MLLGLGPRNAQRLVDLSKITHLSVSKDSISKQSSSEPPMYFHYMSCPSDIVPINALYIIWGYLRGKLNLRNPSLPSSNSFLPFDTFSQLL